MAMKEYVSGYNLDRVGFQSFLVFFFFPTYSSNRGWAFFLIPREVFWEPESKIRGRILRYKCSVGSWGRKAMTPKKLLAVRNG